MLITLSTDKSVSEAAIALLAAVADGRTIEEIRETQP